MPMHFLQLTDLHIKRPGRLAYRRVDSAAYLSRCVAHILAQPEKPDAIVLTGGLTLSERFLTDLKKWLAPLGLKVLVYPGEEEMSALASRLLAVMAGKDKERSYDKEVALRG